MKTALIEHFDRFVNMESERVRCMVVQVVGSEEDVKNKSKSKSKADSTVPELGSELLNRGANKRVVAVHEMGAGDSGILRYRDSLPAYDSLVLLD